jgi:hypothetical protein
MNTHIISLCLTLIGIIGLLILSLLTLRVFWYYQGNPENNFRWRLRTLYLKQISMLLCLFCLAMAASYSVLLEPWALLYLIIAIKAGIWWFRITIEQRMY